MANKVYCPECNSVQILIPKCPNGKFLCTNCEHKFSLKDILVEPYELNDKISDAIYLALDNLFCDLDFLEKLKSGKITFEELMVKPLINAKSQFEENIPKLIIKSIEEE